MDRTSDKVFSKTTPLHKLILRWGENISLFQGPMICSEGFN